MKSLAQLNIKNLIQQEYVKTKKKNTFSIHDGNKYSGHEHIDRSFFKKKPRRSRTHSLGTFIDYDSLSLLVSEDKVIKTWPTKNWSLLMVDQLDRFAIFESDDSFHMAILNIHTGAWKEDNEGDKLYFSESGEAVIDNFHSITHPFPDSIDY